MISSDKFIRYLVSYPSKELKIFGFINVPRESGHYPVIVALHGYVHQDIYQTLDYSSQYADVIAGNGYIVIHPNLRNFPPSDSGPAQFHVGYAEDVLNLLAMVRKQAGQPGLLAKADATRIGLWGHSMGGGIALRVLTLDPNIRAAVLYGAVSGDLTQALRRFGLGGAALLFAQSNPDEITEISPSSYYADMQASVSIHHGEDDPIVPLQWSKDLCSQLTELGKTVECFYYPDAAHIFNGDSKQLFNQRSVDFFRRTLR